ncbi:MurR/RpiR family transcriptional regulator [Anaerospora hongkongensis]|uniref:MurR/RpiR family transcriptional regulator n=1 Tax=Anaerospora hongkongensis TaxID=244830 RepID=UPI00289B6773|nr:MurR/RpiR family transcriptional regulator [Anaerospora hongkongensis]
MEATVLQVLEEKMEDFTLAQRKVADYVLKNPAEVAFLTTEQLASNIGVSVASIMRLAYAVGYSGYAQFQKDLQEMLRKQVAPPNRLEENIKKIDKNKLLIACAEIQIANINKTVTFLTDEAIDKALSLVFNAKRLYVIGVRGSHTIAHYLYEGMNRLGVDCQLLIPDTGRLQSVLAKMSPDDLVIAISLPRYARRTLEIVRVAKSKGAKLLSITDGYSSPLALVSDAFLPCAFESAGFHNSEIGALFVADFLVTSVAVKDMNLAKQHLEEIERVISSIDANAVT